MILFLLLQLIPIDVGCTDPATNSSEPVIVETPIIVNIVVNTNLAKSNNVQEHQHQVSEALVLNPQSIPSQQPPGSPQPSTS